MGTPIPGCKQDTVPFSTNFGSSGLLDSALLVEGYPGDTASPLSMPETHRSNNGSSRMTRTSHPSVAHLGDPQTLMRSMMWHSELNDFLGVVRSNTPADTVRGLSGTSVSDSSDLSFLYKAGDSHLDHSTPFDTGLIQGIAAWSDELWKGDRQQPKTFSIHPRNEAEARAAVKKMLRACAATSLVDDSFGVPSPSNAYERKPCLSHRRLSSIRKKTLVTSAQSECPVKQAIDSAVVANLKGEVLSHRNTLQADVEAQESMVAYAELSKRSNLRRNITIMLLVALFFGIAMRFNYWIT